MQHISDKEFDRLFKDGLEEAEIQPPASLWDRIEPELSVKKRNNLPYLWMAAASVVVVLGAGLWLFQSESNPVIEVNTSKIEVNTTEAKKSALDSNDADLALTTPKEDDNAIMLGSMETKRKSVGVDANLEEPMVELKVLKNDNILIAMQPIPMETHPIYTEGDLEVKTDTEQALDKPILETALANTDPVDAYGVSDENQPEKARIRNAGDLVNFVVDKLDKREQKILEFKTDEDDNSSLIAINIGPFKLNQRKHK